MLNYTLTLYPKVVYVFGGRHGFCAVYDNEVEYLPSSALGLAQWFGVTAFLFCVHSMVGIQSNSLMFCLLFLYHSLLLGDTTGIHDEKA